MANVLFKQPSFLRPVVETRRPYILLAAVMLLCLSGCGAGDEPEPSVPSGTSNEQPATKTADSNPGKSIETSLVDLVDDISPVADPSLPKVTVVELMEWNEDDFPTRLWEEDDGHGDATPPLQIVAGQLLVHEPHAADGELAEETANVSPTGTPLSQCKLFILHHVIYAGVGRVDNFTTYYGFASPPGEIKPPLALAGKEFVFDPNVDSTPFEAAIDSLRVYPDGVAKLEFIKSDDRLTIKAGGSAKTLAAREQGELFSAKRTLTLREKPLLSTSVATSGDLFDSQPAPAPGPAKEISAGQEHGARTFSTKLSVHYHGELPLKKLPAARLEQQR